MSTATVISPTVFDKSQEQPPRISIEEFLEKYRKGKDGFKYEWNNGIIEKTTAMKQNELYISQNLIEFFFLLQPRPSGILSQEIETWTTDSQWRKPDLAYFTQAQIRLGAGNTNTIPPFVVEVISQYDPINTVNKKLIEYFNAGVKIVWHIFPDDRMVYVFTSIKNITVCMGDDICSAEAAIAGYQMSVNDIFLQR